jgi:hypothetical protein
VSCRKSLLGMANHVENKKKLFLYLYENVTHIILTVGVHDDDRRRGKQSRQPGEQPL